MTLEYPAAPVQRLNRVPSPRRDTFPGTVKAITGYTPQGRYSASPPAVASEFRPSWIQPVRSVVAVLARTAEYYPSGTKSRADGRSPSLAPRLRELRLTNSGKGNPNFCGGYRPRVTQQVDLAPIVVLASRNDAELVEDLHFDAQCLAEQVVDGQRLRLSPQTVNLISWT